MGKINRRGMTRSSYSPRRTGDGLSSKRRHGNRRKGNNCVGERWWSSTSGDAHQDFFQLGTASYAMPNRSRTQGGRRSGTRHRPIGRSDNAYTGVDAYIHGLRDIGTMPQFHPQTVAGSPFTRYERHNFHRIPGYAGFVPGAKCKEEINLVDGGSETSRLSHLLSRNLGGLYGGGYVDDQMPRTISDEMHGFKTNPEMLMQFQRTHTDVWPTIKDVATGQ